MVLPPIPQLEDDRMPTGRAAVHLDIPALVIESPDSNPVSSPSARWTLPIISPPSPRASLRPDAPLSPLRIPVHLGEMASERSGLPSSGHLTPASSNWGGFGAPLSSIVETDEEVEQRATDVCLPVSPHREIDDKEETTFLFSQIADLSLSVFDFIYDDPAANLIFCTSREAGAFRSAIGKPVLGSVTVRSVEELTRFREIGSSEPFSKLHIPSLRQLCVHMNSMPQEWDFLSELSRHFVSSLRTLKLELANNFFLSVEFTMFANLLPLDLEVLELGVSNSSFHFHPAQSVEAIRVLAECMPLSLRELKLDWSHNKLGPVGAQYLAARLPPSLRKLTLKLVYTGLGELGAKSLVENMPRDLEELDLDVTMSFVSPSGAVAIGHHLPRSLRTLALNVSDNAIGAVGADGLCAGLPNTLRELYLNMSLNGIGPSGAHAIRRHMPPALTTLQLDVSSNRLGPEGMDSIARAFPPFLTNLSLDVSINGLGPAGALSLGMGIPPLVKSLGLDVSQNSIGRQGVVGIASALTQHVEALWLNISSNEAGQEGIKVLASRFPAGLRKLKFEAVKCSIDSAGAVALSENLSRKLSKVVMDLRSNMIGKEEAQQLLSVVSDFSVEEMGVDLRDNRSHPEDEESLPQRMAFRRYPIALAGEEAWPETDVSIWKW